MELPVFLIPDFKGFDFFPHGTVIPFMKIKRLCLATSLGVVLASIVALMTLGLNLGVDFRGGSLIEIRSQSGDPDLEAVRPRLNGLGLGDIQLQELSGSDLLLRIEMQSGGEDAQQAARDRVVAELGEGFELRRAEVVGPAISAELRQTGAIALLASLVAIGTYIWFRFEWQFAAGTIIALVHDVCATLGLISLLQITVDLGVVAALLTILGYSVNDSVVVADRIRENLRKFKREGLDKLLDRSINETLSRTVLTGITTVGVLLTLFLLGGEVLREFAFVMLVGVLIGTYSSIFIGAPVLGYLGVRRDWQVAPSEAAPDNGPNRLRPSGADQHKGVLTADRSVSGRNGPTSAN